MECPMAWIEIDACKYAEHFANPLACYLRSDFNLLNASKVDAVRFFAFDHLLLYSIARRTSRNAFRRCCVLDSSSCMPI